MGYALARQGAANQAAQQVRVAVQLRVNILRGQLQRRQARRHRHRVTGQGTRLVHRTIRCELLHNLATTTKSRRRQTAGDDLAKRGQVTRHAVHAVPAGVGGAEAGHHFVQNQKRAVLMRNILQFLVEVVLRCNGAHVAGRGLRDHTGNLARVFLKRTTHRINVVVRHHNRVRRLRTGHTRGVRQGKRSQAGARRGQQRIHVAVVAAVKLDNLRPARETARQTHRRHGGLRTGVDHAHLFNAGALHNVLCNLHLGLGRRTEAQTVNHRRLDSLKDLRARVAVDHRPPGVDQVNVGVSVNVDKLGAMRALDKASLAADGPEAAHRRVHTARSQLLRAGKQLR